MARRYDRQHRRIRAKWADKISATFAAGKPFPCARGADCQLDGWIRPGQLWDLDHDDSDPTGQRYLGPSHRRCNRGEPFRRLYAQANGRAPSRGGATVTDPRTGVVREPGRAPRTTGFASGPRSHEPPLDGSVFDPGCPDCRRTRSACDLALKWAREDAEKEGRWTRHDPPDLCRVLEGVFRRRPAGRGARRLVSGSREPAEFRPGLFEPPGLWAEDRLARFLVTKGPRGTGPANDQPKLLDWFGRSEPDTRDVGGKPRLRWGV